MNQKPQQKENSKRVHSRLFILRNECIDSIKWAIDNKRKKHPRGCGTTIRKK